MLHKNLQGLTNNLRITFSVVVATQLIYNQYRTRQIELVTLNTYIVYLAMYKLDKLLCAIRLPHTNIKTFHIILNCYYHREHGYGGCAKQSCIWQTISRNLKYSFHI